MMSNIQVLIELETPNTGATLHAVEPAEVVRRIVDRYSLVAADAQKQIAWWSEPTEFGIVYSDSSAIEHIITNLVDNTVRYAEGYVEIGLTRDETHFYIRVWDDGPGIASRYLPYLFDRGLDARGSPPRGAHQFRPGPLHRLHFSQALRRRPGRGQRRRPRPRPSHRLYPHLAPQRRGPTQQRRRAAGAGGMKAPNHPTGPGRQRPRPAKAANPTPAAAPAHVPALLLALLVLALGLATACVRPLPRPDTAQPANPAETAAPATPSRPMAQAQPTATPTVAPTAAPIPTSTPTATPAPTVTPTVAPTPPPTATPPATPTATPTPTVTPTAAPTPTPPPTITPTPENQPLLEILTPLDRSVVRQDSVNIQGVTEIGGSVSVRGQVVAAGQGGRFQAYRPRLSRRQQHRRYRY